MVADVALVTEDHVRLVVLLAAALAHRAVQAAPALLQDHFCHLSGDAGDFLKSSATKFTG